jgi:hypothetical protein
MCRESIPRGDQLTDARQTINETPHPETSIIPKIKLTTNVALPKRNSINHTVHIRREIKKCITYLVQKTLVTPSSAKRKPDPVYQPHIFSGKVVTKHTANNPVITSKKKASVSGRVVTKHSANKCRNI